MLLLWEWRSAQCLLSFAYVCVACRVLSLFVACRALSMPVCVHLWNMDRATAWWPFSELGPIPSRGLRPSSQQSGSPSYACFCC